MTQHSGYDQYQSSGVEKLTNNYKTTKNEHQLIRIHFQTMIKTMTNLDRKWNHDLPITTDYNKYKFTFEQNIVEDLNSL